MVLTIRNKKTKAKTHLSPIAESAHSLLCGRKTVKYFNRMKGFEYSSNGASSDTEVYASINNILVTSLKQTAGGVPKLDCCDISPIDSTLLRTFQSVIAPKDASTLPFNNTSQRFVLKNKWYRLFDSDGKELVPSSATLARVLSPDTRINLEYHMSFIRSFKDDSGKPNTDPVVRKITILPPADECDDTDTDISDG